jgi:hypothetical protein
MVAVATSILAAPNSSSQIDHAAAREKFKAAGRNSHLLRIGDTRDL